MFDIYDHHMITYKQDVDCILLSRLSLLVLGAMYV